MQEDHLQKAFEYVKNTYFPEWDKEREWKILECPEELSKMGTRGVDGVCDDKTKTIKISMTRLADDVNDLYCLLTHEICHCQIKGHDEDWQNEMLYIADIAEYNGCIKLSEMIRKDVDASVILDKYSEKMLGIRMYGRVKECIDEFPSISFNELMTRLIEEDGATGDISEKWIAMCRSQYEHIKKKAMSSLCKHGHTPEHCDQCEQDAMTLNIPSPPTPEQFGLTEEQINYFKTMDEKKPGFIIKLFSFISFIVGFVIFGGLIRPDNIVQFLLVIVCAVLCASFCKTSMLRGKEIILNHRIKKIKTSPPYQNFLNFEKALKDHKEEFKDSYDLQAKIYLNEIREEKKRRKRKIVVDRKPEWWVGIDGMSFELKVTELLMSKNYKARHVGSPYGDGGVDIVLKANDKHIIIQCKAHKDYINQAVVRDLYGTLKHQNADEAWLIATSGFYKGAKEFAVGKPIKLLTVKDLMNLPPNELLQRDGGESAMSDRLQKAFEYVKNTYFPGWDEKGEWKVEECSEELSALHPKGVAGLCEKETKTIKISMTEDYSEDKLYALLIHEICHCDADGHDGRWLDAMSKIAEMTKRTGSIKLSEKIERDVDEKIMDSIDEFRMESKIYHWVSECIDEDPNIPFDGVMGRLIEKYGVPKDISEKWIKICKRDYDYIKRRST